ncbi:hypothetical protein [Embleya sp. AB8]|uniref:hypothetical protein n=1 Tax=Embleya sp. AB8 TaxID=3156304 RepID=UPI003C78E463
MIVQLYGEWTRRSDTSANYEQAVAGCQEFADRQKKAFTADGRRHERAMVNKGLALYLDVPHHLLGFDDSGARGIAEVRPNDWDSGFLSFHVGCRRSWTDGVVTAPESVLWEAIHAYWSIRVAGYAEASARERQACRRGLSPSGAKGVPSAEDLSGLIDYTRCRQSGPVVVVAGRHVEFEEPADPHEQLPFLVALSDPLHPLPHTGPYSFRGDGDRARPQRTGRLEPPLRMGRR